MGLNNRNERTTEMKEIKHYEKFIKQDNVMYPGTGLSVEELMDMAWLSEMNPTSIAWSCKHISAFFLYFCSLLSCFVVGRLVPFFFFLSLFCYAVSGLLRGHPIQYNTI